MSPRPLPELLTYLSYGLQAAYSQVLIALCCKSLRTRPKVLTFRRLLITVPTLDELNWCSCPGSAPRFLVPDSSGRGGPYGAS